MSPRILLHENQNSILAVVSGQLDINPGINISSLLNPWLESPIATKGLDLTSVRSLDRPIVLYILECIKESEPRTSYHLALPCKRLDGLPTNVIQHNSAAALADHLGIKVAVEAPPSPSENPREGFLWALEDGLLYYWDLLGALGGKFCNAICGKRLDQ